MEKVIRDMPSAVRHLQNPMGLMIAGSWPERWA